MLSIDENGKLIMFGSRARGDFNEKSDWDFLMLTTKNIEPVSKHERYYGQKSCQSYYYSNE